MALRRSLHVHNPDGETEGEPRTSPRRSWFWHVLYIMYCLEVGGFLLFLPWLGIWENNFLLYRYPKFRPFVANAFLKGAVLGLGLVNILIGIQEIVHFKRKHFPR